MEGRPGAGCGCVGLGGAERWEGWGSGRVCFGMGGAAGTLGGVGVLV